ncbi:MAG TPA: helix-turn-helix domain-containing protein [Mycobacteriales bacterium]|nr:helix-turn-helix domain-containing protein [Mycobacteriales bacterium]
MADTPPTPHAAVLPDDVGLARTRLRFLTSEPVQLDQVRETILASWWRSRDNHVPADRLEVPYFSDQDLDTPLIHSAEPVLHQLGDQLDGQPISLILTDASGVVLTQSTGDADLHRHLESVELVPGFSYSERFVGTNGIGTALEVGGPINVFGHEHYAENLEDLACAGVPICHPITGKIIGAVDLTCWRKDAGGLLIALARTTAEQVRQALLATSSIRELALFRSYLQACRHAGGIVMALNDDVVMMNDHARRLLHPVDQSMLLAQAAQALASGRRTVATLDLPTGGRARLHCRRIPGRGDIAGGVLHVELLDSEPGPEPGGRLPMVPMFLPGLVGSAPLWLRCCREVDAGYGSGEWLALTGEPGVGKHALASGVHLRRNPNRRLHVVDAADAGRPDWLEQIGRELVEEGARALVIRHVDRLDGPGADALAETLRRARTDDVWVAVTLDADAENRPELTRLLALLPRTVQVPPLRHHLEDLHQLVPFVLSRLSNSGELTCTPAAMQLLMRSTWPGNVRQLQQVLQHVARHRRRTGGIRPADLPAEYHTVTRRPLSQLESMERDAIVQTLQDAHGNKARAAKSLGMSRATIYRKIHDYGIAVPEAGI